ncbi:MAG: spondin domain-containing protein [Bryobacteraceae bacterium]
MLFVSAAFVCAAVSAATIRVTVTNTAPANGIHFTPVWVGFHNGTFDIFDSGAAASAELERLAEDGNTTPLDGLFQVSGAGATSATIGGAPIAPGASASMTFTLDGTLASNRYFSFAAMVIPSNDAFVSNGDPMSFPIFDAMGNFTGADFIPMLVWDAGTEVNDEIPANTAFLGQAVPDTGTPEGGVITAHPGFLVGGNIVSAFPNANFNNLLRVQVEEVPEPGTLVLLTGALPILAIVRRRIRR